MTSSILESIIPEWHWDKPTHCGAFQWNRWGIGFSLTHWALPVNIRMDHQDCGHANGFSVSVLCFTVFRNFYDCEVCE